MHLLSKRTVIWSLLGAIVLLASVLRLNQLGSVPVSLYWDEVASAYNAYSIDMTLKDEHGRFMPLLFQSFDDYKMPAMVYMMAASIKVFGLTEFAARLPMALIGIVMVFATYFLVKELFSLDAFDSFFPEKRKNNIVEAISLLSAFLLAISPWHLQFSRVGYEAGGAVAFIVFGTIFFLKSFHHPRFLIISAVLFGISIYFYRSVFVFLPLFLLAIFLIFRKDIFAKLPLKIIIISLIIGLLIAIPITYNVFTPPGSSRANEVSIFTNSDKQVSLNQMWAIQSGNGYLGNIFYNKRFVYLKIFLNNYTSHFSPQFLFLNGDSNPRHSPRNMGVMYLWEFVFVLLGIYVLLTHARNKITWTLLSWWLIGPIPAAIAIDDPHALRSLNTLPVPQIIVAIGVVYGFYLCWKFLRPVYIGVVAVLVVFSLSSYLFNYYTTSNMLSASDWGDGYKEMNQYVLAHQNQYDKVIISGHYWEPYVYTLFYTKYDPAAYQESGDPHHFGKYVFGGTDWVTDGPLELDTADLHQLSGGKKSLMIITRAEYAKQKIKFPLIDNIKDSNGNIVYLVGVLPSQNPHEK